MAALVQLNTTPNVKTAINRFMVIPFKIWKAIRLTRPPQTQHKYSLIMALRTAFARARPLLSACRVMLTHGRQEGYHRVHGASFHTACK